MSLINRLSTFTESNKIDDAVNLSSHNVNTSRVGRWWPEWIAIQEECSEHDEESKGDTFKVWIEQEEDLLLYQLVGDKNVWVPSYHFVGGHEQEQNHIWFGHNFRYGLHGNSDQKWA